MFSKNVFYLPALGVFMTLFLEKTEHLLGKTPHARSFTSYLVNGFNLLAT